MAQQATYEIDASGRLIVTPVGGTFKLVAAVEAGEAGQPGVGPRAPSPRT